MAKRQATSHDVARLAGESRTTVSQVLNNRESDPGWSISELTRQRVLDAAEQLGYRPNAAGRSLRSQRTGLIGLIIREPPRRSTSNSFSPLVMRGIWSVLSPHGVRLIVEHVDEARPDAAIDLVRERHVDALIFSGARPDDRARLHPYIDEMPIVLWGGLAGSEFPFVDVDNVEAARVAVDHLIKLGHRRIACILNAAPDHTGGEATDRLRGYQLALDSHGLSFQDSLVRYADFDEDSGA